MRIDYNYPVFTVPIPATLGWKDEAGSDTLISDTNCLLEQAARHRWEDPFTGRRVALGVLKQFETSAALEARGWSAERIQQRLEPSRQVFATSSFMQTCQEWPRGYAAPQQAETPIAGDQRSRDEETNRPCTFRRLRRLFGLGTNSSRSEGLRWRDRTERS